MRAFGWLFAIAVLFSGCHDPSIETKPKAEALQDAAETVRAAQDLARADTIMAIVRALAVQRDEARASADTAWAQCFQCLDHRTHEIDESKRIIRALQAKLEEAARPETVWMHIKVHESEVGGIPVESQDTTWVINSWDIK